MVFDAFLGPHYSYINKIPNPETLGAGGGGSMKQMSKNVSALLDYVNILSEGCNKSAKNKGLCEGFKNKEGFDIFPLGNKFFLKTLGKCDNGEIRYLYINNRPTGLGNLRGVVPGIIEDTFSLNPVNLFMGFSNIGDPKCAKVAGQTINDKSQKGSEEHWISCDNYNEERSSLTCKERDGCCKEGFLSKKDIIYNKNLDEFIKWNKNLKGLKPKNIEHELDTFSSFYIFGFSLLVIYMISALD